MNKSVAIWLIVLLFFSAKTAAQSKIRLVLDIEPPYVNIVGDKADNNYTGIHIDVVRLLANKLNKKLEFISCPFIRCLSLMKNGSADVIIGVMKTKERSKFMNFLDAPYHVQHFPLNFYLLKGSKIQIKRYRDLYGLGIGTIRGSLYFDRFDKDTKLTKSSVTTVNHQIQLLLKNRVDTVIARADSVAPWLDQKTMQTKLKLAEYKHAAAVGSYIAISQMSPLMADLEELNIYQQQLIDSGKIEAIVAQWIEP